MGIGLGAEAWYGKMDCVERGVLAAEHYFGGGTCASFDKIMGYFGRVCFVIGGDGKLVGGGEP